MSSQLGKWLQHYSQTQGDSQAEESTGLLVRESDIYEPFASSTTQPTEKGPSFGSFNILDPIDFYESDEESEVIEEYRYVRRKIGDQGKPISNVGKLYRNLAYFPVKGVGKIPIYKDSPELTFTAQKQKGNALGTTFLPALPTFFRFPQLESSALASDKKILYEIFRRSFSAGDYEIAAEALWTYGRLAPLTFPDMVSVAEMILHSQYSRALTQTLLQLVSLYPSTNTTPENRVDFLAVLVYCLTKQGELQQAKETLRNKISLDKAQGSSALSILKSLIIIFQVCQYANIVLSLVSKSSELLQDLPASLATRPHDFLWAVFLLHTCCTSEEDLNNKITVKIRQESQHKLGELRFSFAEVAPGLNADSNELIEYQVLYLAYLLGTDQSSFANKHLNYLIKWYGDSEAQQGLFRLLHFLEGLISYNTLGTISSVIFDMQLRRMSLGPADESSVLLMMLLYKHGFEKENEVVCNIAEYLESKADVGFGCKASRKHLIWFDIKVWVLWECLASILGNVQYAADDQPIHESCGLVRYNFEMAAMANNSFSTASFNLSNFNIPDYLLPPRPVVTWRDEFQSSYGWWMETLLCPSSLGDFCLPVLPSIAHNLFDSLDNVEALPSIGSILNKVGTDYSHAGERIKSMITKVNQVFEEQGEFVAPEPLDLVAIGLSGSNAEHVSNMTEKDRHAIVSLMSSQDQICDKIWQQYHAGEVDSLFFEVREAKQKSPLLQAQLPPAVEVPEYESFLFLGNGILEILTWKAVVASHLASTDHYFVLRVVQILVQHCYVEDKLSSSKARSCLKYLQIHQFNLKRCYDLSVECYYRDCSTIISPPTVHTLPRDSDSIHVLNSGYQPQPIS